jgi:hypothetical protein
MAHLETALALFLADAPAAATQAEDSSPAPSPAAESGA